MGIAMGPGVTLQIQPPCLTTVPYNAVVSAEDSSPWLGFRCHLQRLVPLT